MNSNERPMVDLMMMMMIKSDFKLLLFIISP